MLQCPQYKGQNMAKITKPLTDTQIKKAESGNYFDGSGLYLEVTAKGKKYWRIKYKYNGKDKRKSLGEYPTVTLAKARIKRANILTALDDGLDPFAPEAESARTFAHYCKEFIKNNHHLSDGHIKRIEYGWERYAKPIRNKPMDEITAGDIVKLLHVLRDKGIIDSGVKLFSSISQLFSWTISNYPDLITINPCGGLKMNHVLGKQKVKSYPSISEKEPQRLGKILKSIDSYSGFPTAKRAIQLITYTAVRPGNIQKAEWCEFDLEDGMRWTIPKEKMKDRTELIVPLAKQVVEMLKEWKSESTSKYLFPGRNTNVSALNTASMIRVLSDINSGLVTHSWRSVFSTFTHTHKRDKHEVIEMQLSHSLGTAVSKTYNRTELMDERIKLMQWWADYLDNIKNKESE